MLLLMLQLIFCAFLLALNGEPFRALVIRRLKLFSDLDLPQIFILDVYLGGLILYVIAILPLNLFSKSVIIGLTVLNALLSVLIHFKVFKHVNRGKIRITLLKNKTTVFDCVFLFGIFIFLLGIQLIPIQNLVFGSTHDTSIHSLMVEVLLENNHIPLTLQPYLPEGIVYPQASHVIFAFACYVLNYVAPKAVLYVTPLFIALSVFGAYFLGKKMWSYRPFYLGLSFIFAFVSSWPLYITWGANPFVTGFPLFLVVLGLFFSVLHSRKKTGFELVILGLLFGYAGAIIVSYLQILLAIAVLILIYCFIKKCRDLHWSLLEFFTVFLVSLIPLSPFLFRFFAFYQYPGHNIGIPSDFSGYPKQQFFIFGTLTWTFENLSPHFPLRVITISLLIGLALLLWKTRDHKNIRSSAGFALAISAAAVLLSFVSFFLPSGFNIISWGHQGILLTVPLNIFILIFFVELAKFCDGCKLEWLSKIFSKKSYSNLLLKITVFSLILSPFLYYRVVVDPGTLSGSYNLFAGATQADYDLMLWMKENLTSNAVILVNPYEAGLFIPSFSHHKIVFPYSGSSFTRSYQTLVASLWNCSLDKTAYELMLGYNVSYVFVGSKAIYHWLGDFKWNPELFLGNPNFKLVKNFRNAYLFKFDYVDPNIVFMDDFEYSPWNENGWQAYSSGNGLGNVTIATESGYNSQRSLRLTAQAVYTVWEWKYCYWVSREIFVQNNSDVTFSFYFNATEGFHGADTFAIVFSNFYHNQTIAIATPNGVFENYAHTLSLNGSEGLLESINLSTLWYQAFNSSLPNPFILELANYDFDGIKNVAYIDDIKITSTPTD